MSKLETLSVEFRDSAVARNTFNDGDNYTVSHDDALSSGDEPGKGENSGAIGSLTDIKMRTSLGVKNKYNSGNIYDASNA
jgi:hypothetical protein